jgi:hypothetical protein
MCDAWWKFSCAQQIVSIWRSNRDSGQASFIEQFVTANQTKSRVCHHLIWEIEFNIWWNLILTIIRINVETKSWLETIVSCTLICIRQQDRITGMILSKFGHTHRKYKGDYIFEYDICDESLMLTIIRINVETKSWIETRVSHTLICIWQQEQITGHGIINIWVYIENLYFSTAHALDSYDEPKIHMSHPIPVCVIQPNHIWGC